MRLEGDFKGWMQNFKGLGMLSQVVGGTVINAWWGIRKPLTVVVRTLTVVARTLAVVVRAWTVVVRTLTVVERR